MGTIPTANRPPTRRGVIHFDLLASLGLTFVVVGLFTAATLHYSAARRETDTRRLLWLAAAAELDQIRAGVHAMPTDEPSPTGPDSRGIMLTASAWPGEGAWSGLMRVRVTAGKHMPGGRLLEAALSSYIDARPPP